MIANLTPYPEYRETEGGGIGKAPAHWSVHRMKYLLQEIDARSTTGKEQLLRISQYTGVTQRQRVDGTEEADTRARTLVGYKRVAIDDLVINIMLAWNGSMGVSRFEGIASPAYCVYRFREDANPWYFHYLLRSPIYKARIKASSTGVVESRLRLYSDALGRIEALLPPEEEQVVIIRFLNWANNRLERAIRSKRKVIALLNEQKQAIIHHVVTRGLNPNISLKPSGVPWIGDIPAHWELRRLKSLLLRNDGGVWGSDFTPEGTVVLRSTEQAVDGSWQIISPAVIRLSESQIKSAVLEAGDIVVTKSSGSATHIGKASLVSPEVARMRCCYSNFMQRLRTNAQLVPEYLHLFLNSNTGRTHYQYTATSTTGLGNLTRETIATLPIPLPQPSEQLHILDSLKRRLGSLNESLSRLEREIDLLIEYRTSLAADVVTGKLDVRQAAANLPDEMTLDTPSSEDESDYIDNLGEEASE
jgi:type I restriction enzyme, S subunit